MRTSIGCGLLLVYVAAIAAFWGVVIFVALHFLLRFW
jgi:hypothetical protein